MPHSIVMSHILKPCPPSSPYGPAGPKFKQNGQRYPGGGGPQYYLRRTPLDESPPGAKVTRARRAGAVDPTKASQHCPACHKEEKCRNHLRTTIY